MTPHQKNDWREELHEIIHRNWKNDDEVTLYKEVETLLTQQAERIAEEVEDMRNVVDNNGTRVTTDGFVDTVLSIIRTRNT